MPLAMGTDLVQLLLCVEVLCDSWDDGAEGKNAFNESEMNHKETCQKGCDRISIVNINGIGTIFSGFQGEMFLTDTFKRLNNDSSNRLQGTILLTH